MLYGSCCIITQPLEIFGKGAMIFKWGEKLDFDAVSKHIFEL
jgi:hypothetical protein